jgi:hypothetical protein
MKRIIRTSIMALGILVLAMGVLGQTTTNLPSISPSAGPYQNSVTVTITESMPGYAIHYTTDGTAPTASSTPYTGPFVVKTSETVRAIGVLNPNSAVASVQYTVIPCLTSVIGSWTVHEPISVGTSFQVTFDATPSLAKMDGIVGLSSGVAAAYGNTAPTVRFNNLGFVDAINGLNFYQAVAPFPYIAGTSYHFVVAINTTTKTYSVTVNGVTIATNYAFRPGATATPLDTLNAFSEVGTLQVCNLLASNTVGTPPPATHSVALSWNPSTGGTSYNVYRSVVTGGPYSILASAGDLTAYIDTTVSNGGVYYYVVTALDSQGQESLNSIQAAATIPLTRILARSKKSKKTTP